MIATLNRLALAITAVGCLATPTVCGASESHAATSSIPAERAVPCAHNAAHCDVVIRRDLLSHLAELDALQSAVLSRLLDRGVAMPANAEAVSVTNQMFTQRRDATGAISNSFTYRLRDAYGCSYEFTGTPNSVKPGIALKRCANNRERPVAVKLDVTPAGDLELYAVPPTIYERVTDAVCGMLTSMQAWRISPYRIG